MSDNAHVTDQQVNNEGGQSIDAIEATMISQRQKWSKDIEDLNEKMKDLPHLDELMNEIYSKRQNAVDYYYAMNNVILKQSKTYKERFNTTFNTLKVNGYNGMRFSTDQQISRHVEVMFQDQKELIDLLVSQNNFIKETIGTIDNMIYGIGQKIKVKEMLNGLKF